MGRAESQQIQKMTILGSAMGLAFTPGIENLHNQCCKQEIFISKKRLREE